MSEVPPGSAVPCLSITTHWPRGGGLTQHQQGQWPSNFLLDSWAGLISGAQGTVGRSR